MLALAIVSVLSVPTQTNDLVGFDKVLHFGANVAIVDVAWAAAAFVDAPLWTRVVVGVGSAAAISIAKELWDAIGFGAPSIGDLAYDALGIVAGVGYAFAVEALFRRVEYE